MAQEQGATGHGGDRPEAAGVPADESASTDRPTSGSAERPADRPAGGPAERPADGAADDGLADEEAENPENWGRNGLVGDGRYRLTRRLGRGGMADVFAAEDVRLGRLVAVKLLRPDLAEDPVAKARFTREAQSVAGLNHHAVVAVYDSGEETVGGNVGAVPYIVMELVNGLTIRELLNGEDAQTPEQALLIVAGVLEALAYSHQHGIVHRDIKPANVIITDTGSVKVMDFGIARALHGAQNTMTQTGMVMGTPQYLSPEQALGKAVDTRSDLYAVGCLLYELLTERPPFTGETPLSVVYQHVQDTARLPSEVSGLTPPELDGLVMRSLAKDPDDRFQTAEEMRSLVLYAVRMLETHGGHTAGLWNTGSATADTPAMGTPAMGQPQPGPLGPPLLLGKPGGEDPAADAAAKRTGRLRYLLVALLAVAAVGVGVLIAISAANDNGTSPQKTEQNTPPPKENEDKTTPPPTKDDDEDPIENPPPDPADTPDWTPTPEPDPTESETEDPTTDGGTTEGGEDEGGDGGTTEGGEDDGGTTDGDPTDPADPTEPTDPTTGDPGGGTDTEGADTTTGDPGGGTDTQGTDPDPTTGDPGGGSTDPTTGADGDPGATTT